VLACTDSICLLKFGTALKPVYGYPVFKHYEGTDCRDTSVWPRAYFTSDPTVNADWTSRRDHAMDLLLGVIIFPDAADAYSFALEAEALLSQTDGDLLLADRVYPAMRAAIDGDVAGYDQSAVCGTASSTGAVPRNCFMVVYNIYDNNDYEINYDHYELYAGACRNSVSFANGLFATEPVLPTALTESFYECVHKAHESAFIAIGLSYVNADLASRWFFMVFMLLVVGGLTCFTGFDPKLGYHDGSTQSSPQSVDPYGPRPAHHAGHKGAVLPGTAVFESGGSAFDDENPMLVSSLRALPARPSAETPVIKGFSSEGRARGASALARRKADSHYNI
jgi:hypothetical protein